MRSRPRSARLERWITGPALAATARGRLGLALFLLSGSMLFGAVMVAYVSIRLGAGTWPPALAPPIPRSTWLSTALAVGASVLMARALRAARAGDRVRLAGRLRGALALAVAFLGSQAAVWVQLQATGGGVRSSLYGFTFHVFSALHAVHVVGGAVPLVFVLWRAGRGAYDAHHCGAVEYLAAYWHFLTAVWLLLFVLMVLW
ncbi:MAG: cytochrome c oxidase subunit 3 [Acidobacteriota bacterium]|nr:cytochrome c oxidase subunit 3 [Acidobacteriota bacterium]MDQ7087959.1 cytochrome c oxidase subunit 3 [Acidobacteriota bacterium]